MLASAVFLSIARTARRTRRGAKAHDKEFMATLAKGLAVLGAFDKQRPAMTLSEAALAAGCRGPRATHAAYACRSSAMSSRRTAVSLSPGILELGFAYLSTQNWIEQAAPLMRH